MKIMLKKAASNDGNINEGVVEMQATDSKGRIRIRVDYLKEGESE